MFCGNCFKFHTSSFWNLHKIVGRSRGRSIQSVRFSRIGYSFMFQNFFGAPCMKFELFVLLLSSLVSCTILVSVTVFDLFAKIANDGNYGYVCASVCAYGRMFLICEFNHHLQLQYTELTINPVIFVFKTSKLTDFQNCKNTKFFEILKIPFS
ncbi:hypothetical protein PPYR_13939 [Photinus pyralis]|uniref:Uncharacterized protein n=1 Tax=Photinus pyralis TaxID=7054 RepID=A0A5N4A3W0_PHOPY|nr:hypothetical protein PPYR_13939 [Photinus pyralis]